MLRLVTYFVVALIGAVAGYWLDNDSTSAQAATFAHRWIAFPEQGKQDRLVVPQRVALTRTRDQVRTIEAVGDSEGASGHDAAIVYRDRNGAVVFSNDPEAQATVAVKGIALPSLPSDATVRQMTPRPATQTAPQESLKGRSQQTPTLQQKPLEGCEPSLSPLASREASAFGGRCLASRRGVTAVAFAR